MQFHGNEVVTIQAALAIYSTNFSGDVAISFCFNRFADQQPSNSIISAFNCLATEFATFNVSS